MTLFVGLVAGAIGSASGAVYTYDFGTSTGTYNTSSGTSTTFLPAPTSGGGTAFVRNASSTAGKFTLSNPGNANLGSGSELIIQPNTAGSAQKFSLYGFTGSPASRIAFSTVISGTLGTYFVGIGSGSSFSDANTFSSAQIATGLTFTVGASGITTTYRSGSNNATTGLTTTGIVTGSVLSFDIYTNNNTSGALTYGLNGNYYSVAAGKFDIFLNGSLIGDDLNQGPLTSGSNIDSFMIYGTNGSGTSSDTLAVDDIIYGTIVPEPTTFLGGALLVGVLGWNLRRQVRGSFTGRRSQAIA